MRQLILGALVSLSVGMGPAVQAQATDPQLMAPITKFLDAFNKGDIAGASATHASEADLVIIDEVPPFVWRGAPAFATWAADLERNDKKHGITDQKVSPGTVTRVETDGASAYVVVAAVYTFKQADVAMRETAQMTFALKKGASGWLIHGWTWTGPKARKVQGSAKK
jgi:hypothetical protein